MENTGIVDFKENVKSRYFMEYEDFCEVRLSIEYPEEGYCYKCSSELVPLTWLDPEFYFQPCQHCSQSKRRNAAIKEEMIMAMKDFYNKILGDRYYQLFLVDGIYLSTTFPHKYSTFKKVVDSLSPPSRNEIWFLDWNPGYPKIISPENLDGIKIVNLTKLYDEPELGKKQIKVGDYEITMPEMIEFDKRHHSRYALMNKKGDRKSKRLKIGKNVVKFYNSDDPGVKSIFKLTKGGESTAIRSLSYQDFVIIKLAIMRDKAFMRLIFDIILETSRTAGVVKDTIFLKNTINLDKEKDTTVNFIWSPFSEFKNDNDINISII